MVTIDKLKKEIKTPLPPVPPPAPPPPPSSKSVDDLTQNGQFFTGFRAR